jgi:PAS domain S-box-containing protein
MRGFEATAWVAVATTTAIAVWVGVRDASPLVRLSQAVAVVAMGILAYSVVQSRRREAGQRAAERALGRSMAALQDLKYALDQSALVATTNVRGDITYANGKFCEISKYSRDELIGRNHRILNSGLHPVEFFQDMYRTIAQGGAWRGEIRNRAKDGTLYWVDTTIVPFVDGSGRPHQYIAIRYDITERKLSEAALRNQTALARLGKMAAVVAHEVRNPLAGIRGALQIIGRRLPAATQEATVIGEVVARIDTLNHIVEDMLMFARPRSPVLTEVSLARLVEKHVALLRADPRFAEVELQLDVPDESVTADPELLGQALVNLLINSAQALEGRGEIRITARRRSGWQEVRIIDHGPGIPPEAQEHLFEPFFTTRSRGTGLGLATARRILEGHGGSIDFECPPSGGTIFTLHLPGA